MSKSYDNAIFLSDPDDIIEQKVGQMITDPQRMRRDDPGNPDICNVFSFHEIYTDQEKVKQIDHDCRQAAIGCVDCKNLMARHLIQALIPIKEKRRELESNIEKVKSIIEQGNERARKIARMTMEEVKTAVKI
jgi:tryptophanyl-tRNA synthetase